MGSDPVKQAWSRNHLLAAVAAADVPLLRPHAQLVSLAQGEVLFEPEEDVVESRAAQADAPGVTVRYSLVVGKENEATRMLVELVKEHPAGVLVVMGSHGRTGLSRLIWGNRAEEIVRVAPCPVLVVKEPAGG